MPDVNAEFPVNARLGRTPSYDAPLRSEVKAERYCESPKLMAAIQLQGSAFDDLHLVESSSGRGLRLDLF
jgi:hypothetical protein